MTEYYAHSLTGEPPEKWQKLEDHLRQVAVLAEQFASVFHAGDWGWNAGWLHDVGKATNAFQSYLHQQNDLDDGGYDADGSVSNHASAGAAFAQDRMHIPGKILAYILAGHHAGLPDWYSAETGNAALSIRLEEGRHNLTFIEGFVASIQDKLRPLSRPPAYVKPENAHFWIRMLFSCLVDADRLDTEKFCDSDKCSSRGEYPNLGTLAPRFFQALEKLEQSAVRTEVNTIRSEIRNACESAADEPSGLFSLTVPTGGGKTLSGMAFALRHALRHGKRRIIYVIPYTSIIEQTASVLGGILGRENIVEHHSNLDPERSTPRSEMAAENWDAPIVVTTSVQFFESLYAAKTGAARKLHNIANSVVILDEAQMLPPELLTPCVEAINHLVSCFGVTLVLATATQPALPKLLPVREIIPPELNLYARLRRTAINLPPDWQAPVTWPELASRLSGYEQVLCIVNTRRDCHDLFTLMPEGTIHLSALMCGEHRSEVIADIKRRLLTGSPCRVISTQLVEAGVDIDFPVVYRALAGLDSIAQAAGRCNREGKLNTAGCLGEVHVFIPPKPAPLGLLRKGEDTMREMPAVEGFDPQEPACYTRYFQNYYARLNSTTGRPGSKIEFNHDLISDFPHIPFRTAGYEFRMIDDAQQAVFVRWGENDKWLNQLRAIGPTRDNLRALQRSCVNLPRRQVAAMKTQGMIEEIWSGFWLWIGKYDKIGGLDLFGDGYSIGEHII